MTSNLSRRWGCLSLPQAPTHGTRPPCLLLHVSTPVAKGPITQYPSRRPGTVILFPFFLVASENPSQGHPSSKGCWQWESICGHAFAGFCLFCDPPHLCPSYCVFQEHPFKINYTITSHSPVWFCLPHALSALPVSSIFCSCHYVFLHQIVLIPVILLSNLCAQLWHVMASTDSWEFLNFQPFL